MDMKFTKRNFIDLTLEIAEDTLLFPGDPAFCRKKINSLKKEKNFELQQLFFCNHIGTHIDFPSHVFIDGKNSSDFTLWDLIGNGKILEIPKENIAVTKEIVLNSSIIKGDFVFFKTSNSDLLRKKIFNSNFVYIEPEAAEILVQKGVRVVGIDYLSPDKFSAEELPVHKILLSNDILIVEGLNLYSVQACDCKIYIMPLKIPKMDGLPARVIIEISTNE